MVVNRIYRAPQSVYGNNQEGFSTIEVIIAMAIIAMAMLAAATMQFNTVRNNTSGNIVTQANMLAKSKIEELKNTIDLTTIDGGGVENSINAERQPVGIYDLFWAVANLGSSARSITVTVQWNRGSQTRSISIATNTRGNGV